MNAFRKEQVNVLVASDIAARGIDVSQVSQVINFDIPDTVEAYTHRTGRTGRMEHLGKALTLATLDDIQMVRSLERLLGARMDRRDASECNLNKSLINKNIYTHDDQSMGKKNDLVGKPIFKDINET